MDSLSDKLDPMQADTRPGGNNRRHSVFWAAVVGAIGFSLVSSLVAYFVVGSDSHWFQRVIAVSSGFGASVGFIFQQRRLTSE